MTEKTTLSLENIKKRLDSKYEKIRLELFPVTASTNTLVRERAIFGEKEGLVVIAEAQTGGRGRRDRSFYSPAGTGLYMSVLLRPKELPIAHATSFTTMAAVSMCEAIEEVCDRPAEIKWVNDIIIEGRKVCGILTEGFLDMKTGLLDYAVLGVGVNVCAPREGFPADIINSAGSLCRDGKSDLRSPLAAAFLNHFLNYYYNEKEWNYISEYKRRSLAVGKEVVVLSGNDKRSAFAYDVDEECRLLVRYENGETEALSSGEISIKLS